MNKNKRVWTILLLSFGAFFSCTTGGGIGAPAQIPKSAPKPKTTQTPNTTPVPTQGANIPKSGVAVPANVIRLTPNLSSPAAVNQNIISFNTGFMFINPLEKEPEVSVITKKLSPKVLRFPGGTIGNFYHPDGLGYGMKSEETGPTLPEIVKAQPQFKQNAIHHFADLCRMSNSKVMYVANMLTGTPEEMIKALQYFKQQNIEVVGVELGNEFYFRIYSKQYPTVETYIKQAKEYAAVIRKFDPKLRIAVVAADPTEPNPKAEHARFMNRWNELLGKETFYDAYIPHLYPKVKACEDKGGENLQEVFDCINLTLATDFFKYHEIVVQHYKQYFGNKKMWVTEWNVDAASTTANTIAHAAFVAEFLMGLVDANVANKDLIEYAFFHNYGSGGYAAPIFSLAINKHKYTKKVGNIAYNTTYFPFQYLSSLIYSGAKRTAESIEYPKGSDAKQFVARTFISADKKKMYVMYANKSGNNLELQLMQSAAKPQSITAIKGKYAWSVAGLNGFYLKQPQMVDLVEEIKTNISNSNATIPAYSVGIVEYVL